ncbi:single-stranded DNA-binding protein [Micropruina sp.]|uniref:single-stranded DNA-binding protein n=1 Tax=Micropruina sp. TaxID=2737536 RepID=UPI0039E60676
MSSIQTQQSVAGFVASDPQLSRTERGDARLYMKIGIEHYRREADNSFTKLETTFHDLIAFRAAAEYGHQKLAKGDNFIADGRVREYSYERDGQRHEGEEFVAARLGHDLARTRYDVDRSPRTSGVGQDSPARDSAAFTTPERASQPAAAAAAMGM